MGSYHGSSDAECIVDQHERYWVVKEIGEAAEAPEERDVR
jgi:hypothetical protein